MICKDCRYFESESSTCRKNPPTAHVLLVPQQFALNGFHPAIQNITTWPQIPKESWCGAFEGVVRFQGIKQGASQ